MSLFPFAWRFLLAFCLVFNGGVGARAVAGAGQGEPAVAAADSVTSSADCPMHAGKSPATGFAAKAGKAVNGDDCCGDARCHCAGTHVSLLALARPTLPRLTPNPRPAPTAIAARPGLAPEGLLRPPIA